MRVENDDQHNSMHSSTEYIMSKTITIKLYLIRRNHHSLSSRHEGRFTDQQSSRCKGEIYTIIKSRRRSSVVHDELNLH